MLQQHRYFNFRDNGVLNCGNIGLKALFESNGYSVFSLNQDTAPVSMNKSLVGKIGEGITSDSFFYIATKGDKANDMVQNW